MKRIWNCRLVLVIPVVIGALGTNLSAGDALQYGALATCVFAEDRQNY